MEIDRYYSMSTTKESADIVIFGDITSWPWLESDVSSYMLSKQIAALDVAEINVRINSYGGEVAEGLAIHNALISHAAKVRTYCSGFACSAASVVFMAGEERHMYPASLLMIHNAWSLAAGNAEELRKAAADLEIISETAANAYKRAISITDEELAQMLDEETWITPEQALEWGFATAIVSVPVAARASQSVRQSIFGKFAKTHVPTPEGSADPPAPAKERAPANPEPAKPAEESMKKQKLFFNFREEKTT